VVSGGAHPENRGGLGWLGKPGWPRDAMGRIPEHPSSSSPPTYEAASKGSDMPSAHTVQHPSGGAINADKGHHPLSAGVVNWGYIPAVSVLGGSPPVL